MKEEYAKLMYLRHQAKKKRAGSIQMKQLRDGTANSEPPKGRARSREGIASSTKIRRCRVCGCTDDRACPGGCYWIHVDLCSCCFNLAKG